MSDFTYLTADNMVTDKPLILHSVIVTTDGGGPGKVVLYNGQGAESGYVIATLLCEGGNSNSFHWKGLRLDRGLYVDFVEKADYVTVEWEPVGYRWKDSSLLDTKTVSVP